MKKFLLALTSLALAAGLTCSLVGCADQYDAEHTITVGASPEPHAQILHEIKNDLKEQGYKLVIKNFDDYILPNTALENGELDANYFQHTPYLNTFNEDHHTNLVAVEKIHYEPFGVFGKGVTKEQFETTKTGRTILVPNDGSNLTRALFVLQDAGYIELAADATATKNLTVNDIADKKGNTISAVEAVTVTSLLAESPNGTIAVVNGNYAIQAGYDIANALAVESAAGEAAQLYANIIAVKKGNENSEKIQVLISALKTQKVIDFIAREYAGAVLPVFSI